MQEDIFQYTIDRGGLQKGRDYRVLHKAEGRVTVYKMLNIYKGLVLFYPNGQFMQFNPAVKGTDAIRGWNTFINGLDSFLTELNIPVYMQIKN